MNALGTLVFVCGVLVYECIWQISFIKIQKYAFTDSFGNHLTIKYSFGKLAIWQTSFRNETKCFIRNHVLPKYKSCKMTTSSPKFVFLIMPCTGLQKLIPQASRNFPCKQMNVSMYVYTHKSKYWTLVQYSSSVNVHQFTLCLSQPVC